MGHEPFFRAGSPGWYTPNPVACGPWDPRSLHARVLAGLAAHEAERDWTPAGFRPARLTIDVYRLPALAPVALTMRMLRDGNRVRLLEAEAEVEGKSVARATVLLLRASANPPGEAWSPAPWGAPPPMDATAEAWGEDPQFEVRRLPGRPGDPRRPRAWLRDTRELVEGVSLTPFVRAALAADFTNPFANWSTEGLQFINADITVYLHRLPEGEWIGFETDSRQADSGIAVAACALYDAAGAIGHSLVASVTNPRAGGS